MPTKHNPAAQANEPVLSAQDVLDIQEALVERDTNRLDRFSNAMLRAYINNPENNYAHVNEALQSGYTRAIESIYLSSLSHYTNSQFYPNAVIRRLFELRNAYLFRITLSTRLRNFFNSIDNATNPYRNIETYRYIRDILTLRCSERVIGTIQASSLSRYANDRVYLNNHIETIVNSGSYTALLSVTPDNLRRYLSSGQINENILRRMSIILSITPQEGASLSEAVLTDHKNKVREKNQGLESSPAARHSRLDDTREGGEQSQNWLPLDYERIGRAFFYHTSLVIHHLQQRGFTVIFSDGRYVITSSALPRFSISFTDTQIIGFLDYISSTGNVPHPFLNPNFIPADVVAIINRHTTFNAANFESLGRYVASTSFALEGNEVIRLDDRDLRIVDAFSSSSSSAASSITEFEYRDAVVRQLSGTIRHTNSLSSYQHYQHCNGLEQHYENLSREPFRVPVGRAVHARRPSGNSDSSSGNQPSVGVMSSSGTGSSSGNQPQSNSDDSFGKQLLSSHSDSDSPGGDGGHDSPPIQNQFEGLQHNEEIEEVKREVMQAIRQGNTTENRIYDKVKKLILHATITGDIELIRSVFNGIAWAPAEFVDLIGGVNLSKYVSLDYKNFQIILRLKSLPALLLVTEQARSYINDATDERLNEILSSDLFSLPMFQQYHIENFITRERLRQYLDRNPNTRHTWIRAMLAQGAQAGANPEQIQEHLEDQAGPPAQRARLDEPALGGENVEGCLPSTSTGRRGGNPPGPSRSKRAVSGEACEYDWDDVDKFNEEQVELREFSKIRINSEKFLTALKDPSMSHAKRMQLVQLAGEVPVTGIAKERVSGVVKHRKILEHLNRVDRISSAVMHGMMWKNMLSDAWKGDFKGVAINAGFIGWGRVGGKLTSAVEKIGSQLVAQGSRGMAQSLKAGAAFNEMIGPGSRIMLGQSLRLSSPFLSRATSAFIAYDLVNQIQACKAGSSEGCIRATGDGTILVIDAIGAGIEVAEVFGILQGVSSVTGPIGGTVSVLIFVGMDVYFAVKRMDEEDKLIHLTSTEKFFEGLRAFGGIGPAEYIERLIAEKQGNNEQYKKGIAFLKEHTDIQRYLLPSMKTSDEQICKTVKDNSHYEPYGVPGMGDRLVPGKEKEECKYKLEVNLDNMIYLDQKYNSTFVRWSRTKPDAIEGNLFCTPRGVDIEIPQEGAYYCDSAMGIEYSDGRTGNATWFELGDGTDRIISFPYGDNIVRLGDGDKVVELAEGNDTVVLYADKTTGAVYGGNGNDTLVLSAFAQGASKMYLKLSTKKASYPFEVMKEDSAVPVLYTSLRRRLNQRLEIREMNNFLLRENKQDIVEVACDTHFIDARGGYIAKSEYDEISIPEDERCNYTMVLIARPYTRINNYSKREGSQFIYRVPDYHDPLYSDKEIYINLTGGNSTHQFVFDYLLTHLYRLFKVGDQIIFSFVKDVKKHDRRRYHPYEIKVSITQSGANNLSFILKDNTEIKVLRNQFYVFQNTNSSVEEVKDIIRDYPRIAQRLKLSISVFSKLTNETIMIGNGKQEALFNDPFSQRTHLIGNGGENIFVVTSGHEVLTESQLPIPEVLLYDRDDQNLIDTLDLRQLSNQVEKDLGLKVKQRMELLNKDIGIELFVVTPAGNRRVVMVRLKDASVTHWYKRLHVVINHAPMELDTFKLRPLPLEFSPDINFIIITPEDIEEGTTLAIPKKLGNIHYFRSENNLFITNRFDDDIPEDGGFVLLLKEFYQEPKLETIIIRFTGKELVLRDEMASIRNAVSFLSVYAQYNRTMYDEIFAQSTTQESITPVLRSHSRRSHHELADGKELSKNAQGLMPLDISYPVLVGAATMFIGGGVLGVGALVAGGFAIKRMITQHRVRANALPMTVVQAAAASPLLSAKTVEAKSINNEVVLANTKSLGKDHVVQLDGCVLGARDGDKLVTGLTCYTKDAQVMIFPKESDIKLVSPEDKLVKESCRPVEFNGRPSVYCEGEESNMVYTPATSQPPFSLDQINDLLLLSQVGLHLGKKLYNKWWDSSAEKINEALPQIASITTEQKTRWIELLVDIETRLAHLGNTDKVENKLLWVQSILEDRKEEYQRLRVESQASVEAINDLTENLQALQAELEEIQESAVTAKLPSETDVLGKAESTRMSAISSNSIQPVALVEQQLRHRVGWAVQGNNTLSFFQSAPSLFTSNDSRINATSIQQQLIGGR